MSETRNDYGFPLVWPVKNITLEEFSALYPPTSLERAHAIAAEVRARRFPPVKRITPAGDA